MCRRKMCRRKRRRKTSPLRRRLLKRRPLRRLRRKMCRRKSCRRNRRKMCRRRCRLRFHRRRLSRRRLHLSRRLRLHRRSARRRRHGRRSTRSHSRRSRFSSRRSRRSCSGSRRPRTDRLRPAPTDGCWRDRLCDSHLRAFGRAGHRRAVEPCRGVVEAIVGPREATTGACGVALGAGQHTLDQGSACVVGHAGVVGGVAFCRGAGQAQRGGVRRRGFRDLGQEAGSAEERDPHDG